MPDKLYQVYILQNQQGRRYIGLSENISKRLEQHNAGESKWTAKKLHEQHNTPDQP